MATTEKPNKNGQFKVVDTIHEAIEGNRVAPVETLLHDSPSLVMIAVGGNYVPVLNR